jgi:aminopeptidase N
MKKVYLSNLLFLIAYCCSAQMLQNETVPAYNFFNAPFSSSFMANDEHADEASVRLSPTLQKHYEIINKQIAAFAKPMGINGGTGLEYDVKYYRLQLRINPDTVATFPVPATPDSSHRKYIRGAITTYFTTNNNNFTRVDFDFANALICDSVYYHGVKLAAGAKVEQVDTLKITLPSAIPTAGTLDSVTVYYKGVPPAVTLFGGATGYVQRTHGSPAQNYMYTLSEPYSAYTWWPCKSRVVNDKADSVDLIISTPSAFKAAGNGSLISETNSGGNRVAFWKIRYGISSYQVATAVANYVQYPTTPTMVNISGTNMPYFNYLFPETNTAAAQTALDRTPDMITTMSSKFGDYPFKNEKYGHYTFGFGGGMEHNTFSGMGFTTYNQTGDWSVIAHELGHQWFGASVTCGSWKDIWVNESFARYSEVIALEFSPTLATAVSTTHVSHRGGIKTSATSTTPTNNQLETTFRNDTSTIATIFSPSVYIYERGAMFVSMLRTLVGDTKFFQAIQNYQNDPLLKYKNAYTNDVERHLEATSGLDLSTMFSQWLNYKGFASYSGATWNNSGNSIILKLPQTKVSSDLPAGTLFTMPVAVRIRGALPANDTTIIAYDQNGSLSYVNFDASGNVSLASSYTNTVQYNLTFTPTTVTFDSYNQVFATGAFAKNTTMVLATSVIDVTSGKQGDNTKLLWTTDNSTDYAQFEIEKGSDGINFEKVGTLYSSAANTSNNFSFVDYGTNTGTWYYRIKVIQKDGTYSYSKIIVVNNKTAGTKYVISPNPANNYIIIKSRDAVKKATVKLFNANGSLVKEVALMFTGGNAARLQVNNLATGNYFAEITGDDGETYTKQIVIAR